MPVMVFDPNLRAGWEPDTPDTDSLLRQFLANWTASLDAIVRFFDCNSSRAPA